MDNKILAAELSAVAEGSYCESVLKAALEHPVVTFFERVSIRRFLNGTANHFDGWRLQAVALRIRCA